MNRRLLASRRTRRAVILAGLVCTLVAGCAPAASSTTLPTQSLGRWVDQPVSFEVGGVVIYATYRHPSGQTRPIPAALLIAGSGPTDRNGNTPLHPGPINTLKTLADWLSADGVASLRYDKLGSGRTGLGSYASHPDTIGIWPFEQESAAALRFLAQQPGVDRKRLAVFGHSEGALFALLLATGHAERVPHVHALGLLEPLSLRYLDMLNTQVDAQLSSEERDGQISSEEALLVERSLARSVRELRKTGTVPPNLPYGISSLLNPTTTLFLSQADRYDPAQVAAHLPTGTPVLVSCSNADTQVTCSEVDQLVTGLRRATTRLAFVHLTGVDHVLKEDPSGVASNFSKPLPSSPQLREALKQFVEHNL